MEENEVLDTASDAVSVDVVTELQYIRSELQAVNAVNQELRSDVVLLVMFVAVLVVYEVRNVFLSFVKKGGIKRDV